MELLRTGRADIEVAELKELVAETLFPGNGPRDDPKEVTWAAALGRYVVPFHHKGFVGGEVEFHGRQHLLGAEYLHLPDGAPMATKLPRQCT